MAKTKTHKTLSTLADLTPDTRNANKGTDRGRKMVMESLMKYGAGRSIVADRDGKIIAGNKTLAAADGRDIIVVPTDGSKLVVVQRTDLSLDSKGARELAIADNRTAELGLNWDADILQSLDVDLSKFWSETEIRKLIGEMKEIEGPDPRIDEAELLLQKWKVKPGQMWAADKHRIYCGDSTSHEDWQTLFGSKTARMCFTDPPWNVGIGLDSNPRHRQRPGLKNDSMSSEDFNLFISGFSKNLADFNEGDVYCVLGASEWPTLDSQLRGNGFHWSATIIWVKDIFVLGRSKYHRRYEPLWYGWHAKGKSSFCGLRNLDDVWEIPRPRISEHHPTIKPLELVARAIKNSSGPGDLVVDPFLGSGTTVIAAAKLERVCYGMDLEPKYIAVTLERLSDMGLEPKLVANGKETQYEARSPKPGSTGPDTPEKPRTGRIRGNRHSNKRSEAGGRPADAQDAGNAVEAGAKRKSKRPAKEADGATREGTEQPGAERPGEAELRAAAGGNGSEAGDPSQRRPGKRNLRSDRGARPSERG